MRRKAEDQTAVRRQRLSPDFEAHALWMDADVDLYSVAAEETRLVARGATADNVIATGIPSARSSPPKWTHRRAQTMRDDLPTFTGPERRPAWAVGKNPFRARQSDRHIPDRRRLRAQRKKFRRDLAAQDRNIRRVRFLRATCNELMTVADLILEAGRPRRLLALGKRSSSTRFPAVKWRTAISSNGAGGEGERKTSLPHRAIVSWFKKLTEMAKAARHWGDRSRPKRSARF